MRRWSLVAEVVREVLAQGAAGGDVDELHPAADPQQRHPAGQGPARQRDLDGVAQQGLGLGRRVGLGAVAGRGDVRARRSASGRRCGREDAHGDPPPAPGRGAPAPRPRRRAGPPRRSSSARARREGPTPTSARAPWRADADERRPSGARDPRVRRVGSRRMMALAYTIVGLLLGGGLLLAGGIVGGLWFAVSSARPDLLEQAPPQALLHRVRGGASVRRRRAARGPHSPLRGGASCAAAS